MRDRIQASSSNTNDAVCCIVLVLAQLCKEGKGNIDRVEQCSNCCFHTDKSWGRLDEQHKEEAEEQEEILRQTDITRLGLVRKKRKKGRKTLPPTVLGECPLQCDNPK
eukprot:5760227-Amphidinium_carterae.1